MSNYRIHYFEPFNGNWKALLGNPSKEHVSDVTAKTASEAVRDFRADNPGAKVISCMRSVALKA
jgi:hypothetical protein